MTDRVALMTVLCGMLLLADAGQVVVNGLLCGAVGLFSGLAHWEAARS